MSEHPILFSAPMVRAILAGSKTQTRRIVKPQPDDDAKITMGEIGTSHGIAYIGNKRSGGLVTRVMSPYGQPGDRLWVRETWMDLTGTGIEPVTGRKTPFAYAADTPPGSYGDECRKGYGLKWRPSIFMPRRACRITLEVTGVRVERLQEIAGKDIIAEGAVLRAHDDQFGHDPVSAFDGCVYLDMKSLWAAGWNKINAARAPWASNPFVWVLEFRRIKQ